jgi:hypothetical protein
MIRWSKLECRKAHKTIADSIKASIEKGENKRFEILVGNARTDHAAMMIESKDACVAQIAVVRLRGIWKKAFVTDWKRTETIGNVSASDGSEKAARCKIITDPAGITQTGAKPTPEKHGIEKKPQKKGKDQERMIPPKGKEFRDIKDNGWKCKDGRERDDKEIGPDIGTQPGNIHHERGRERTFGIFDRLSQKTDDRQWVILGGAMLESVGAGSVHEKRVNI